MLTAVPTYIALSDLGFGAAAAFDMTKKVALDDQSGALTAFQSVWSFVSCISAAILVLSIGVWLLQDVFMPWVLHDWQIADAALLLICYSLVALQMNLVNIAYRSIGRYAQGTFLLDLLIPVERFCLLAIAFAGGKFTECAVAMLCVRCVGFFAYYHILRRSAPWVCLGWTHASVEEVRTLAKPAFAALSLPLSTALSIQGAIFVFGIVFNPATAALFGTIRTISRVPLQLAGTLSRATIPEMTIAHSKGDQARLDFLIWVNLGGVALVSIPSVVVFLLFGQQLLDLLARGHLHGSFELFLVMSVIMVLQATWNTFASFLVSLNRQQLFAYIFACVSALSLVGSYYLAPFGLVVATISLLFADALMLLVVIVAWRLILQSGLEN